MSVSAEVKAASMGRAVLSRKTKAVILGTSANPTLELIDIAVIADLAHQVGAQVVVDNVFLTPLLQRPFDSDADIVVYSATKHIDQ